MQESLRAKYAHDERDKYDKMNSEKAKKIEEDELNEAAKKLDIENKLKIFAEM